MRTLNKQPRTAEEGSAACWSSLRRDGKLKRLKTLVFSSSQSTDSKAALICPPVWTFYLLFVTYCAHCPLLAEAGYCRRLSLRAIVSRATRWASYWLETSSACDSKAKTHSQHSIYTGESATPTRARALSSVTSPGRRRPHSHLNLKRKPLPVRSGRQEASRQLQQHHSLLRR